MFWFVPLVIWISVGSFYFMSMEHVLFSKASIFKSVIAFYNHYVQGPFPHSCAYYHVVIPCTSTWQKLADGVFANRRRTWMGMSGRRTCTACAAHSLDRHRTFKQNLVSPILSTAWQPWRILWNVYSTIHEQVWTHLLRRTSLFQNWAEEQRANLIILNEKYKSHHINVDAPCLYWFKTKFDIVCTYAL